MTDQNMKSNTPFTVCFTGHRTIDRKHAFFLPTRLNSTLEELILRGADRFCAGGATGFDTLAALAVLELKKKHPHIRLDLILPCPDQTVFWRDKEMLVLYDRILKEASSVTYVSDRYTSACMHARNRRLVSESQVCVAYMTRSGSGTSYTFAYALQQGLKVINLADLI